ncbi:MAG: DUF2442 domain-containing protein [Deltaproteobacteria bacterium]|nr:DUF2442 domain-containing protein [Deltaproteobacteria bacterium]
MTKSSSPGKNTSPKIEVLGLTPHALWLSICKQEYMLDYKNFPWFQNASIKNIQLIEFRFNHLYWPKLDIDLNLDSITNPEKYPLISKKHSAKNSKSTK